MNNEEIVVKFCIKGKKGVEITRQELELTRKDLLPSKSIGDVVLEVVARNIKEPRLTESLPSDLMNTFKEIGIDCLWYRDDDGYPATFSFLQSMVVQYNGDLPDCGN